MRDVRRALRATRELGISHVVRSELLRRRFDAVSAAGRAQAAGTLWEEAAGILGAELDRLSPTLLRARLDGKVTHIAFRGTTPFTNLVVMELTGDKAVAAGALREAGIPVATSIEVAADDADAAARALASLGPPVLVKPLVGAGGAGVVGGVRSTGQLARALREAGRHNARAVLEREVDGATYRLLLLDGELLDVIRRHRCAVVGDGSSTVEELVLAEYRRRIERGGEPAGYKPFGVDADVLVALEGAGLTLRSVPAAGVRVVVRSASNFSAPEETVTLPLEEVAALLPDAQRAAAILGARLAGVDIVTSDPSAPLAAVGGVVLEVNALPGLSHHYAVADPARARRVAVPVLARLLDTEVPRSAWAPDEA